MNHHCQRERLSISAIKFCSQIVPNANKKSPCKAHKYRLCRDLHFYSNSSLQSCCVVFFVGYNGRNQGVLSDFYLLRGFLGDYIVILLSVE